MPHIGQKVFKSLLKHAQLQMQRMRCSAVQRDGIHAFHDTAGTFARNGSLLCVVSDIAVGDGFGGVGREHIHT